MAIDRDQAKAIAEGHWRHELRDHTVVITALQGGRLFSASLVTDFGMPEPGSLTVIGPDEQVWIFSSNPGIHDGELVVDLLNSAYASGYVAQLDPTMFAERVRSLTEERQSTRRQFLADLRAGSLRAKRPRRLP